MSLAVTVTLNQAGPPAGSLTVGVLNLHSDVSESVAGRHRGTKRSMHS
jgi:hypothetical protein